MPVRDSRGRFVKGSGGGMKTTVGVYGTNELKRKLRKMRDDSVGEALDLATKAGAEVIRTQAVENALYKRGNLRRSLTTRRASESGVLIVIQEVGTNLVYAPPHEFGATIRAKNGPFLIFQLDSGEWIRTRSVTIPARPFLRPAFEEKKAIAVLEIGRVFEMLVIKPNLE